MSVTQMGQTELAGILEKIVAIRERTFTANGVSQHEAETAASMLASLMLKHNITMMDLDQYAQNSGRKVVNDRVQTSSAGWSRTLLHFVARAHTCEAVIDSSTHMSIVGHEHNIIAAMETYQWLYGVAQTLSKLGLSNARTLGDARAIRKPTMWTNDFKMGFAHGVEVAFKRMKSQVREEVGEDKWALVPVMEQEVATEFARLFPDTRDTTVRYRQTDAYGLGQKMGSGVNTDRQVGSSRAAGALSG